MNVYFDYRIAQVFLLFFVNFSQAQNAAPEELYFEEIPQEDAGLSA